ncbi:MAG: rRNA pseudouridine synthase [Candidatus Eremiobacteraeota bacterium]|nr:rRNA pseudouridine synthase [Candidatus Eremiobacteraeota bacterium]
MLRLQKYLAAAGVASRRRAEELIVAGRVRVGGRTVRELGTSVEDDAQVEVDGRVVRPAAVHTYVVLHKPVGVMTTMRDPEGRRTVADVVRRAGVTARVVPVGRLDYDTSGVLLLTDDGETANVLTHPRFGVEKMYRATVRGRLAPEAIEAIMRGVRLDEGRAAPAQLRVVAVRRDVSLVDITIHEGRNRQVRRMFEVVDHPVVALARLRFGPIALGELAPGAVRPATAREVAALHRIVTDAKAEADA